MPKVNFDFFVDFIQSKSPPLIGVDISSSSVKLVELSQMPNSGGYVVERYVIETLPKDAFFDGNINNLDALADALQRAWKRLGTKKKRLFRLPPTAFRLSNTEKNVCRPVWSWLPKQKDSARIPGFG